MALTTKTVRKKEAPEQTSHPQCYPIKETKSQGGVGWNVT